MSAPRTACPPPTPPATPKHPRRKLAETPGQASLRRIKHNARLYLTLAAMTDGAQ